MKNLLNARLIASITIFNFLVTVALSLLFFNDHIAFAQNVIQNVSNTGNSTLPVWWERTNNDKTR